MRLVVMTDVHANLPALDAAPTAIAHHGYDLLVHTGDAISIGPFPAECLARQRALPWHAGSWATMMPGLPSGCPPPSRRG